MRAFEPGRVRPALETAILLASVAALLLPPAARIAALGGLILLWLAARPPRRERVFVGVALTLASGLILLSALAQRLDAPPIGAWTAEVKVGFERLFAGLEASSRRAAAGFERPPARDGEHLDEFELLERLLPADAPEVTYLLLDPEGDAVAWAGEGVRHEGDLQTVPRAGFAYRRGYTAVTVFAVAPLSDDPRPWRLVAGRSLPTDRLPFETSAVSRSQDLRWSLGPPGAEAPAGALKLEHGEAPAVFLTLPQRLDRWQRRLAGTARQLGIALLGLTLLALALLRATGDRLLPQGSERRPPPGLPLLALAGAAALGIAAGFQQPLNAALAASVGLATWGLLRRRSRALRLGAGAVQGALTSLFLVLAAFGYQRWTFSQDLGASFAGRADGVALRLVWCLAALGLLSLAARRSTAAAGDRFAWWATLLLLAAGAAGDFPLLAVPVLALAGAAIVRWLTGVDFGRRPAALGGLLVLAALTGSVAWEIAYREVFRRELAERTLPRLAPPTLDERNDLHVAIHDHFQGRSLDDLQAPVQGRVDPRDLAFVLWRDSPLAQRDALSALAVVTREGQRSTFSFGLSLDDELALAMPPDRWNVPQVPEWNQAMILGEVELGAAGARGRDNPVWGVVSYWVLLRPGFRLDVDEVGELEEALLRGGPRSRVLDGLPPGVLYGLYDRQGRAISSPWVEAPPLPPALRDPGSDVEAVATPSGRSWVWRRDGEDGLELLFLPQLTPRSSLERVGIHALGSFVWVSAIALLALLFALPRSALKDLLERTVRSYSKRMILVYAVLLLLPLVALNLVLLQSFEDRERREQRASAESALSSARLFLLDYLRGLELGFDLETQVNSVLMEWISSIVEHPVNFYWKSRVFASSQQELFTAGLLPRRIPGEVSRLALSGYKMGLRQHRGEVGYLELYAPLEVDGASLRQGLYLSVPLLEEEEEVARELAALRRRAVLVTSVLVVLLFAAGSRLAKGFTKPLMELIEGTRRIAAGAPFLAVTPREHELEALADAIDDMARRIAEGRRKLVLEKQVVERIVESITSGVVSLDHDRRVLLQNRVAADRLGTEIGVAAARALERDGRLQPVLEFLETAGETSAQTTVELRDEGGEARQWTLTWVPIPGGEDPAALLVVEDATEVLRGQRLEAWAEMARIIAHEIKNPLTPIRLSADHMRQVYGADRERFDEVFERCTDNILKQVEELSDIASDFSIYSRIPRAEMADGDLVAALEELVEGYRDAAMAFDSDLETLPARFDPKLLGRAVRNVLENALRASDGRGQVKLSLEADAGTARIRVVDSGPGVDPDFLRRIFEPYFSTYESGTGLGLAITRRIVEEHGGSIEASNRPSGGLAVEITIPLAAAAPRVAAGPTATDPTPTDPTRPDV